jgi:hypothetical protein
MNLRSKINKIALSTVAKKITDALKKPIDRNSATNGAKAALKEMLDMISKGISPIEGRGRFGAYSAQRQSGTSKLKSKKDLKKKQGYPYSVQKEYPSKAVRPVNLKLSGEFLDSLVAEAKHDNSLGYKSTIKLTGEKNLLKEKGHREYSPAPRPIIPANNEVIAVRLQNIVREYYRAAINAAFTKLKK